MTQGYVPSQAILKKAAAPRFEDFAGNVFNGGVSSLQDLFSGGANRADANQIKSLKAAQSIIPNRNNVLDANNLLVNIAGRVSDQQSRKTAQTENKLVSLGRASKLTDKPKIVNRIASEEAKSIDSARLDLDRQGKEALTQFEKQLRDSNSFDDNEIQDALNSARQQIGSKNKELVLGEAKKTTQFLDKTGGMNPIESAAFKANELTSAVGGQPSIQAQALPIAAKAAAIYQGGGAPLVRTAGQILSAPENLMKQVGYQPEKPGLLKFAGDYLQGVNQNVQESPQLQMLQNQNPIVAGASGFVGESIPFMIAPEGALARNAAASTIKTLAKVGTPSIMKKIAGAAIKEGVQDTGLSALQTGSDLLSQVDSGALTKEQALSQLPSQLAMNAAGDFVGAGVLRGAGDLAGKALKGQIKLPEMPQVETVRGESAKAVLERPATAKPSNDFNMSETYRQIGQEMEKAGLLEQASKFYKKADANDPLLVNAKLKKQKGISQVQRRIAEEEANLQSQSVDSNIPSQVDNSGSPVKPFEVELVNGKERPFPQEPLKTQPLQSNSQAKPPIEVESPIRKNSELDRPQSLAQDSNLGQNAQTGKAGGQFKVDEILAEYGNKKGGMDAANRWLAENKDTQAVQQWVKENKFTNQKQLDSFLSKRHKEVRKPIENERFNRKIEFTTDERINKLLADAKVDRMTPEEVQMELRKRGLTPPGDSPTSKQSLPVQTVDDLAKTATKPIDDYEKAMAEAMLKADPRSFRSGKPPDVKDWTEFQQKYRNPENYNTLDKQIDTKLKPRQKNIINELASTQQVRKNLDETVKKANRELTKQLKPGESITVEVNGKPYTFTRKDTEIVLNAKGQTELQKALDDFNQGREPKLEQGKDSLRVQVANIQPEIPRISQRTKEGLASFIVEKSVRYANVDKEFQALKSEFDNNFKPDELFGKVWTDKNSAATFHVAKGSLKDTELNSFKAQITKNLKGSKAFTEEVPLKYPETVKEGRLPSTSTKRAQEAIKQRLDMAEVKREGVNTVEDIEAISKEFEGVKEKVKKSTKGKSFADAGTIIAALKFATGDPIDGVLAGVRAFGGFNKLAEKTKSKGLYEAAELADAFTGMQRGIETRLMDIDHPAVKKFSDIYKKMAAQEFTIRGKMNSAIDSKLVNPDELEIVKKFFQETNPETVDALFAQHGAIEGITNPAAYAYAEAINDIRRARKEVLGAITRSNALPDNAKKAFETLFALDDSVYGQVHAKINAAINDVIYNTALAYRLTSIPTILTDIPMKTGTTQGFRNTIGAVGDFLAKNPKVVNSELFKSFKAERMGNSWNQELSILAKTSKNPVFRTLQELVGKIKDNPLLGDWFSNTASGAQNIGLIAIAKRFEQKYNKLNNTKIDIFKEYNGSNDVSREFALYANEQLNDLHNAGVGSLAKSGVSGNQLLKPLLFLKSESLRYQNLENKWMQQMMNGSEEVKREAFGSFLKYKMAQLMLGGTTAAGIGTASNLFLSYLTPEQQDNYKESMNYLNIGRLLNIDLTEKLNSAIIQRKPGQSFYEAARSTFDGMKNPIVQAVLKFPDAINNWEKAKKNGDLAGQIKALTAPLPYASGLGDLMAKAVRQYRGEFQPFYVQTAPGKFEQSAKEFEVSDYAGKSWKIHNAQEMADYERGAKELVKKIGVEKEGKRYKLTKDSAELNSYLNVLIKPKFYNDDPEMKRIASLPDGTPAKEKVKNDIKAELLKSAYDSVKAKTRTDAAKAPVTSPAYWANAKEDSIESTYKLFARSNPVKAKEILREAQKTASKNRKKVLARLMTN